MAGNVASEIVKPLPDTPTDATVTGPVPDDSSVSDFVDAAFTATLPNASALALTVNSGVVGATDPVPLNDTVVAAPVDESLDMVMVPLAEPDVVG